MRAPLCSKMQRAAQRRPRHDAGVGSRSRPSLSDRSGATYSSVSRALREMAAPHEDSSGARLCVARRGARYLSARLLSEARIEAKVAFRECARYTRVSHGAWH